MLQSFLPLNMTVPKEIGHKHVYQFCVKCSAFMSITTNMATAWRSQVTSDKFKLQEIGSSRNHV
jgi:ferredoxin-fold anticodon binding domain-containing protein